MSPSSRQLGWRPKHRPTRRHRGDLPVVSQSDPRAAAGHDRRASLMPAGARSPASPARTARTSPSCCSHKGYEVHGIVRRSVDDQHARLDHIYQDPTTKTGASTCTTATSTDSTLLDAPARADPARRGVPPRGAEPRPGQLRDARVHRRRHRRSAPCACSRPSASYGGAGALLPGVVVGDVRLHLPRRRTKRRRSTRAARTASPRCSRTGRRSTTARPTACSPVNGILFNHESPRRGETFVTRKITRGVARIVQGKQEHAATSATSTPSATGVSPATTSRRMWRMLQADKPDDYRHRHR